MLEAVLFELKWYPEKMVSNIIKILVFRVIF
jgi:hypothetical protein